MTNTGWYDDLHLLLRFFQTLPILKSQLFTQSYNLGILCHLQGERTCLRFEPVLDYCARSNRFY